MSRGRSDVAEKGRRRQMGEREKEVVGREEGGAKGGCFVGRKSGRRRLKFSDREGALAD